MYKRAHLETPILDGSRHSEIKVKFEWVFPYSYLDLSLEGVSINHTLVGQTLIAYLGAGFPTGTH